jgi:hypothetical protein
MRRIALAATVVLAASAGAGCQTINPAAVPALGHPDGTSSGGSKFSYSGGRAVQTFEQSPTTVHPAVLAALDDLRIESVRQISDGGAVVFEGTTADGRKASLTLRPHPVGSRLSARVGVFGDEALSRALIDRVAIRLGALPPAAIPAKFPSSPSSNPYFTRTGIPDTEALREIAEAPYRSTAVPDNRPY